MWSNRVSGCGMITPGCLLALCVKAKLWLSQKWSSACNSLICAKWWLLMYYISIFSSDSDLTGDILDFTISSNKFMAKSTRAVRWSCTGISHPSLSFCWPSDTTGRRGVLFSICLPHAWLFYRLHSQGAVWQSPPWCCSCLKADGLHSLFPQTSKFSVLLGSS